MKPQKLSKLIRGRGESAEVVEQWRGQESACRVIRIAYGEMDRKTGLSTSIRYEVTAKFAGSAEETNVFTGQGRPDWAAWNARLAATAAWYGVDLSRPLNEMPSKLWRAYRDLGAFDHIESQLSPVDWLMCRRPACFRQIGLSGKAPKVRFLGKRTPINTGDSEVKVQKSLWVGSTPSDASEASEEVAA